jgi:hypothetical protein
LRQETRHLGVDKSFHSQGPMHHQFQDAPKNPFHLSLVQAAKDRSFLDREHRAKLWQVVTVESQPQEFPRILGLGTMAMRVSTVNPGEFARSNRKLLLFIENETSPTNAKEQILPQAGASLYVVIPGSPKVSGANHSIEKAQSLGARRVKARSKELRFRHRTQDSILHVF